MRRIIAVSLLFLSCFPLLSAQQADQVNRLHLAQEFEASGLWERATPIYEDLHRGDTVNFVYFDGLQRCYVQLKEYEKAIALTEQRLSLQPRDPALMSALAGLQYDAGRDAVADSLWRSMIALNPNNTTLYQLAAGEMIEHRLYESAIRTYLTGRGATGNPSAFANELANLYLLLQQYREATNEFLRRLRLSPDQFPYVQSQMAPLVNRPQALMEALDVVSAEVGQSPEDVPVRRLLAWLFMESRNYSRALEEYRHIDELTNANGTEIFAFAQRLLQEREFTPAAEAFRLLVSRTPPPASTMLPLCRLGYARALEALSSDSAGADSAPSTPRPVPSDVVPLYEQLAADYPGTEAATQAMFRIGVIRYEQLWDLDGALRAFRAVRQMPRTGLLSIEAALNTGDVFIARNDLDSARAEFESRAVLAVAPQRDRALYRLAELDYFVGRFDSALAKFGRSRTNAAADLANDALQMQFFIQENLGTPSALGEFAHADLLMRQRKYSESLAQFRDITARYPLALLQDDAAMRIGELNVRLGRSLDAIAAFRLVVDSMSASIWKDRAQFRIAGVLETARKDIPAAVAAYETVLVKYPNSLYAEEARNRIRILREQIR